MNYVLLNLGSLLLGLLAWILPVANLAISDKIENKKRMEFSLTSVGACAISLFMQILYTNHLVIKEDWSALMDTSNAVKLASSVLVTVTIALNIIAFHRGQK